MNIVADMSLYPLKDGPVPDIIEFITELREQDDIEIVSNQLSTQIRGEFDAVMGAVNACMKQSMAAGDKVIFDLGGPKGVRMQHYEENLFNFRVLRAPLHTVGLRSNPWTLASFAAGILLQLVAPLDQLLGLLAQAAVVVFEGVV